MDGGATTAGELLLRGDEVAAATLAISAEVRAHLASAMQGPFGVAGAQALAPGLALAPAGDGLPQRFISAGVALSVAYAALADADGVRVAGALRCAAATLFPNDDDGFSDIERAASMAVRHLEPIADPGAGDSVEAMMAMQRRVHAAAASLDRAYLAASPRLQGAALASTSWRLVSGGVGPGSGQVATAFGPFLPALVRFAFFTAAAIHFVRRDDWAWVGAALVGARSDVHRGADGLHGIPSLS